jgi:hypothetical protein
MNASLPNKEMKLTSVERTQRSQLISGVGQTLGSEAASAILDA